MPGVLSILAITLALLANLSGCAADNLDCRQDDPQCNTRATLTLLFLTRPRLEVYWGDFDSDTLFRLRDGETTPETLFSTGTGPRRLGLHEDGQRLYIIGNLGSDLHLVSLTDGTTSLLVNAFSDVWSPVVVEKESRIYLADNGNDNIYTTDLEGLSPTIVHTSANTQAMAIDETRDFQYITGGNDITRFNMDGSGATVILSGVGNPIEDIEIWEAEEELYWVDRTAGSVRAANLDGSNEQTLFTGFTSPVGVATHPLSPYIYVCDIGTTQVTRIERETGDQLVIASATSCLDIDFAPLPQ